MECKIEGLIKESGLRKDHIAKYLGISTKQLRNYETGISLIPIDKAFKLAHMLNKKVDDLYIFEQ